MIDPFNVWTKPEGAVWITDFDDINRLDCGYDVKLWIKLHYVRIQCQLDVGKPRITLYTDKKGQQEMEYVSE